MDLRQRISRFVLPSWARRHGNLTDKTVENVHVMRPMDRMDIYYSGSLLHIPRNPEILTLEAVYRRRSDAETRTCAESCSSCLMKIVETLNLSLFSSVLMICITLSMFMYTLGQFTPFMYVVGKLLSSTVQHCKHGSSSINSSNCDRFQNVPYSL